jgi:hypothetical protein
VACSASQFFFRFFHSLGAFGVHAALVGQAVPTFSSTPFALLFLALSDFPVSPTRVSQA